jgi:hypothetical protein
MMAGCRSWRPATPGEPLPARVRVSTGTDTLVLLHPRIAGDSLLVGTLDDPGRADTVRVPLSRIEDLTGYSKDNLKTFLVVWVVVGLGLGLLVQMLGGA